MSDLRMPDLNRVTLAGRLTRDPEFQTVGGGTPLCKLSMAVSRKYKTKGGELREETLFMDVTTWSGTAEYCNDNLGKGAPIIAEGRLVSNEWEDKTTGQRRSKIEMTADRVQQLAWADSTTSEDEGQAVKHTPVPDDDLPF